MPHYFFSLKTHGAIPHTERSGDFPDLRAALVEANATARSMLHTRRNHAPLEVHGSLDVEDERRRPVARIMLAEVARQIF
jgi:hypothetical protein